MNFHIKIINLCSAVMLCLVVITACSYSEDKDTFSREIEDGKWQKQEKMEGSLLVNYISSFPEYRFSGETEAMVEGRRFEAKDIPLNFAEDLMFHYYYYTITGEFQRLLGLCGEKTSLQDTVLNEEKNLENGLYIKEYKIQGLSTWSEEKYLTCSFLENIQEDIELLDLTEYVVAQAEISLAW